MTEGIKKYIIPDNKREEYFILVDNLAKINGFSEEVWCTDNDPIITIDMSFFSKIRCEQIESAMIRFCAIDITEHF